MNDEKTIAINMGAPLNMTEEETERVLREVVDLIEVEEGRIRVNIPKIVERLMELYEETNSPSYLILGGMMIGKMIGLNESLIVMQRLFNLSNEDLKAIFKLWQLILHDIPKFKI